MSAPHDPEQHRLTSLRNLAVLDTGAEPAFDAVVRMAAQVCEMPIALVSLVDAQRQWFKANLGLPGVPEVPRQGAFCDQAIGADSLMAVSDARQDPRFTSNPLVTGEPGIRFYAGAPLRLADGATVGTLCVMDRQPRSLSAAQSSMLCALRDIVVATLEMRRSLLQQATGARYGMGRSLQAYEADFRSLVESQTDMVSLTTEKGEIVYVNPRYAAFFGQQPAQLVGCDVYDLVSPQDRDALQQLMRRVLNTGLSQHGQNRVVTADGAVRWAAWTNTLHVDPDGQRRLISVGRDITDQMDAQAALQANEDLLANTGRLANIGGWELNTRTQRLTWSAQTRRIHEVHDDYAPTVEGAVDFYAPEARAQISAAIQATIERRADTWDLELPLITAKQRLIWVRAQGQAVFEQGEVVRLTGAIQDITDRKLLEQRLQEGARFVRQMTDSLPFRLAYVDQSQAIRFVNQFACEALGRSADHLLGLRCSDVMPFALKQALLSRLPLALQGQAQTWEFVEKTASQKQERVLEVRLLPDVLTDGRVQGAFLTGIDITERVNAAKTQNVLNTIFEKTTDFVVQTDPTGKVIYMNPAARQALAMALDAPLAGMNFSDFNTPQTDALYQPEILLIAQKKGVWLGMATVYGADKRVIPVSHMVIAHTDHDGHVERYSAVMRDMTTLLDAQRDLEQQTATLRSLTESIPAGVAVVGADDSIRFANSAIARWLGKERFELVGQAYAGALGAQDAAANAALSAKVLAGDAVSFERELRYNGQSVHIAVSYVPLQTESKLPQSYVVVGHDITQHRQESVRLLQMARRDPLTGLLNREGLKQYLEYNRRIHHHPADAVLYIDLDLFKEVNDAHGHALGDLLLQQFSSRLQRLVRPSDAVARVGGDEFVIALEGMREVDQLERVARHVLEVAQTPFMIRGLTLQVAASVGIAIGHSGENWEAMMAQADQMLYAAKRAGKGQFKGPSNWPAPG